MFAASTPSTLPARPDHPLSRLAFARSNSTLVWVVAAWLTVAGNLPLWAQLWALPEVGGLRGALFLLGMGGLIGGLLVGLFSLLAWPWVLKPVLTVALFAAAAASHYMQAYSVVIDPSMLLNVLHTDVREARDLMSWGFGWTLLWQAVLPALWVWWTPSPAPTSVLRRLGRNLLWTVAGGVLAVGSVLAVFQDFASVMRNHKQVRYLINPLNSLYAVGRVVADQAPQVQKPLLTVGDDARLGASYTDQSRPLLLVLVVGETARAANFPLNGYARNTTPQLMALHQAGELLWFPTVWSCGTNTQASVPCMFSHHGKEAHEATNDRYENLLDVLQRAGLAVTWIDNQSGCKGVCDRVTQRLTREDRDPTLCANGECLDGILVKALPEQLQTLPAEARRRGAVVVLHQMGSHGPAYFKRSPPEHKVFGAECTHNALQSCTRDEVVNAYDHSLRYTDQVLADTIAWLKTQDADTGLIYLSDHGESLGENNLYLHGLPYALAPDTQKRVPWATWLSPSLKQRLRLDDRCLAELGQQTWSHDNLFHAMLGLADVTTRVHLRERDVYLRCQRP